VHCNVRIVDKIKETAHSDDDTEWLSDDNFDKISDWLWTWNYFDLFEINYFVNFL